MQSAVKQRRMFGPGEGAFPDPVENEPRPHLASANQYLGVEVRPGPRPEPSYEYQSSVINTVAPEHCMPGRSVFDIEAYPENGPPSFLLLLGTVIILWGP